MGKGRGRERNLVQGDLLKWGYLVLVTAFNSRDTAQPFVTAGMKGGRK